MTDRAERIFLIGPMGAGKSSIGKALALMMTMPFLDLDELIVKENNESIPEIFARGGESLFRKIETEALKHSLKYKAVIATGGGVVVTQENHEILRKNGLVCYLRADVEAQYERTLNDSNRPLIQDEDPKAKLQALFDKRDALYQKVSDITIDSGRNNIHQCVELLLKKIREGA